MNTTLPKPQEILDSFLQRDRSAVSELGWTSTKHTLEARLDFTEARCQDTANMIVYILRYLETQRNEHSSTT